MALRYPERLEQEDGKNIKAKRRQLGQHLVPFFGDRPLCSTSPDRRLEATLTISQIIAANFSEEESVHTAQNECWAGDGKLWTEVEKARLINRRQLQLLLPISQMTIWRYEKQEILPKHFKIGGLSFWRLADVLDAIERLAGPDADKLTATAQITNGRPQASPTDSVHQTKSTLISVREACERSGEKPATIIRWCLRHNIGSHVKTGSGEDWMVDPDRLVQLLAKHEEAADAPTS